MYLGVEEGVGSHRLHAVLADQVEDANELIVEQAQVVVDVLLLGGQLD